MELKMYAGLPLLSMLTRPASWKSAFGSIEAQSQCKNKTSHSGRMMTHARFALQAIWLALNWRSSNLLVAGCEVGLWMTLAFSLEVAGVELTSATKAAFLNQVRQI